MNIILSYGKKCATPRKYKSIFFVRCNAAESSLVLWEKEQPEAPCEALREVAGAPIFAREEAEAFPMESECSFYSVGLVLIFERSKFSDRKSTRLNSSH